MVRSGSKDSFDASSHWKPGDLILDLYEVLPVTEGFGAHAVQKDYHQGGYGRIYKVFHHGWNLVMAVKTPIAEQYITTEQKEMFNSECETWVNIGLHPNIAPCHYVRYIDGALRVFSDYADAGSLADWITSGQLYQGNSGEVLQRCLDLAIQFARGLEYAHSRKVIHQDVKPGNALIWKDGTLKVTDFGLVGARYKTGLLYEVSSAESKTGTIIIDGAGAMTPQYCSPEQATGEKLTRRTDIWSWAASILEMFIGETTWHHGIAVGAALAAYLEQGKLDEALEKNLPIMPAEVAELLGCCFRSDPAKRPQTMKECAAVLEDIYLVEVCEAYHRQLPQKVGDTAGSLNNRALSMLDLGKLKEAGECFILALNIDRQHVPTTYNSALTNWRLGKIDDLQVTAELGGIDECHPEVSDSKLALGWFYLESGRPNDAIKRFEQAIALGATEAAYEAMMIGRLLAEEECCEKKIPTLEGHMDSIYSVVFSPDGRYALSGCRDKTLKLWDVESGKCLRTFEGHTGSVNSVCLDVNGCYALSGSSDKTLKLWDVGSGRCLRTFGAHTSGVGSVYLSVDGRFALSSSDQTLKLWEVSSGNCLRTFEGHTSGVESVCLSADGRYAVSGSMDKTHKLWDVGSGKCLRTFEGHTGWVYSVCLSSDNRFALSGSQDNTLKLWELASGRCLRTFEGHSSFVSSVAFSPDGRFALSGSDDDTLKLWELASGRCLRTFEGHSSFVSSVAFSPDGRFALTGSDDNTLKLWDTKAVFLYGMQKAPYIYSTVFAVEEISEHEEAFRVQLNRASEAMKFGRIEEALSWIGNARNLPTFARHTEILALKASAGLRSRISGLNGVWQQDSFEGHRKLVTSIAFSPDGRYALVCSALKTLELWNLLTGKEILTYACNNAIITSIAFSSNSLYALSGSMDKSFKLWDVESGRCLRTFKDHTSRVNSVAFSPGGRYALSGSEDKTIKLWDLTKNRILCTLEGHTSGVNSVAFSPSGRYALSGSEDKTIKLWDLTKNRILCTLEGHTSGVNSVTFSSNSHYALSGSMDKSIKLWELSMGRCLRTFEGHTDGVKSLSISPDGRYALSGSDDKSVKLWELSTNQNLRTFEGYRGMIYSVSFSPDARYALTGCGDHTLKVWELDWEYEFPGWADWDNGAEPYLLNFLALRNNKWGEEDFRKLLIELSYRGYGWLKPEGVRKQLEEMAGQEIE